MIGSKWVKDGEVAEVRNILKLYDTEGVPYIVWYIRKKNKYYIITKDDFLEQYKPYEPVYEYLYFYEHKQTPSVNGKTLNYYKDDEEFKQAKCTDELNFQRLEFTKRERK